MHNKKSPKILFGFSMLFMGICGISYEYVLGALGNYLLGSSHEQIFVIIGLMMFAMGVGAVFQKLLEKNLLEKFLTIEICLGLIGGISCIGVYITHGFTRFHLPVLWGFAFLIGLMIGLEIPLLIRVNKKYSSSLKSNLSLILSLDYVGSLIGALLFTYLLLKYLSLTRISLILGSVNTAIGLISLFYFWNEVKHPKSVLLGGLFVLGLLWSLFALARPIHLKVEQHLYRDPIIASKTTRYQHITLTHFRDNLALYINGHLQFSSLDEHIYHEFLVHPAMLAAEEPERVLILGGGDGLGLREVLKYPALESVFLVDIDPEITKLASTHPLLVKLNQNAFADARVSVLQHPGVTPLKQTREIPVLNQNRLNPWDEETFPSTPVTVFHLDADLFIQEIQSAKYDVVILDFPDPKNIEIAKLYSVGFYQNLRSILNPNGLVAIQSGSPYDVPKAFASIGKTLKRAGFECLPYSTYLPSFGKWGFYLAWDAKRHPGEIPARLFHQNIDISTRHLNSQVLRASFCFGKDILLDPEQVQENTKLEPVLPKYYREE